VALRIVSHPVAEHLLTILRDRDTAPSRIREISKQLTYFLLMEASLDVELLPKNVETPLAKFNGSRMKHDLTAVPILRSGLCMLPPVLDLFPDTSVGYVGMQRDEVTSEAVSYYSKLPPLDGKLVFMLDPMLATGGSMAGALELIFKRNPLRVSVLSLIAAPDGVTRLGDLFPQLSICAISLDERLNDRKFIIPGMGDFGDRAFGTL
jgi:uracil phosphoribosyltransferase